MNRQIQLRELLPELVRKRLRECASLIQMPSDLIHVVFQQVNISESLFVTVRDNLSAVFQCVQRNSGQNTLMRHMCPLDELTVYRYNA